MIYKNLNKSEINEIYNNIIEVTIQGVKNILKTRNIKNIRYNLINELKLRWKTRVNALFFSLDNSWSKFQENSNKISTNLLVEGAKVNNLPVMTFPLVCTLSGDFYRNNYPIKHRISGFKSWIWNCLVSHVISEGVYPLQSIESRFIDPNTKNSININLKNFVSKKNCKTNFFLKYKTLSNKNFNQKKSGKIVLTMINGDFDKGEEFESHLSEDKEDDVQQNFIVANVEKVYRKSSKWRVFLKEGIIHVDNRDLLFNSCKCEFSW
jgi:hypothetical protein